MAHVKEHKMPFERLLSPSLTGLLKMYQYIYVKIFFCFYTLTISIYLLATLFHWTIGLLRVIYDRNQCIKTIY